jgi:hypothetical protein
VERDCDLCRGVVHVIRIDRSEPMTSYVCPVGISHCSVVEFAHSIKLCAARKKILVMAG